MPGGSADTTGLNLNLTETEDRKIEFIKNRSQPEEPVKE